MEAWSNGEERCSCAEPTLRYIPKLDRLLGALPCPEEGKATQGDGVVRPVSSSSPPGVERSGGARQPFMLFPRVGSSRPLVDSASCPLHGLEVLFHCGPILGTA